MQKKKEFYQHQALEAESKMQSDLLNKYRNVGTVRTA
jgi:hypothetical protein